MASIRLLLVEDNPGDADLISELLSESDAPEFDVECVERLSKALSVLSESTFDLVVADLGLPDSRGLDTLQAILEAVDNVPVVVLTGNADSETARAAVQAGAQDFLVKGMFSADLLARAISYSIERKKNQVRLEHLNRVLLAIQNVNQLIVVEKDPHRLIEGVCHHLIETRGYSSAWIALLDRDGGSGALAGSGFEPGMDGLTQLLEEGKLPPCGERAMETSDVVLIDDPSAKCSDCPLSHLYPGRWGLSARLDFQDSVYGVLTVSIPSERALQNEDEEFLREIAGDIAFALHDIELKAAHELSMERRALYASILETLNRTNEWKQLLSDILQLIKDHTGFEAVGIRLAEDGDYPYFETNGFSKGFVEKERYLCSRDDDGEVILDSEDRPNLECMCGNVIRGRTDPSLPFFTEGGSFWTNSTTDLLSETTESERQARTRNRCNGEGYESVALVPIRAGETTVGLLQLNDRRRGLLRIDRLHFFEEICESIGIAFSRRRMIERTVESEARFRSVFDSGMTGIFFWNVAGEITEANQAFLDLVGYTLEEVTSGKVSWKEMTPPEYRQQDEMMMQELMATRIGRPVEKEYLRKDGSRQPILIGAAMLGDGSSEGVAFVLDITERIRAENDLRESRQQLATLLSNLPGMAYICRNEPDWPMILVSEGCLSITGYTTDELMSEDVPYGGLIHPDDRQMVLDEIQNAIGNAEPFTLEYRLMDKQGGQHWVSERGRATGTDDQGNEILEGFVFDITKRKEAEKALFESKTMLDAAGRIARIGGWELDPQDLSVKWTDETYRIHEMPFDYKPNLQEAVNFFHPDDRDRLSEAIDKAIKDGEPYDLEVRLITSEGRELWTRTICEPQMEDEQVTKLAGIIQDVTQIKENRDERDRLEAQFNQAQRLESVGRLAGGVAHDLNNLLTPILGYSGMLMADTEEGDPRAESIREILEASNRAKSLVGQLLAFSRKQLMEFSPLDVNELITAFERLLRHSLREDVILKLDLADSIPPVNGDAGQLEQVLMNLAVNAQDAMPDGGTLSLKTTHIRTDDGFLEAHPEISPGSYVLLTASDTGTGMPPEVREHIFEPFFTTKEEERGTGLGLATVYGIIKQHDGYIYLDSEPGTGSTFMVYLPVASESGPEQKPQDTLQRRPGKGETILVVEDDEMVRGLACMVLEKNGYSVIKCESPEEAISLMSEYGGSLDLVLTDVVMPKMNGKQLYEEVSKLHPEARVLYMSGYTGNVIAHRGVIDEGLEFIHKPFSIDDLSEKVRQVLDGP